MRKEIIPNTYDYDGEFRPDRVGLRSHTFSLGIFRWENGGVGMRRGKVIYRVRGYSHTPKPVYRRAAQLCEAFDKEKTDWQPVGKKSEWVRG